MNWQKHPINFKNLQGSYTEKYGLKSDFQQARVQMYSHPEISKSLGVAMSWLSVQPGDKVFDIGVNSGMEILFLKEYFPKVWNRISIVGIDIIKDVLEWAVQRFPKNVTFLHGDARTFTGLNIATGKRMKIADSSFDIALAFTSLQSSSFVDRFEEFIDELVAKMRQNSQLLVVVPNCYVNSQNQVVEGLFGAKDQTVNHVAAKKFCRSLETVLKKHGYSCKQVGKYYIFLYFFR